jgi:hypothetical protein
MAEETLTLSVRMPTSEEVAAARLWLKDNLPDGKVRTMEQNYARETVLLSELPPTRSLKLQAIRLGDLEHPLGGYTTWRARSSCLEVEAEPKIFQVVRRLLSQVHGGQ